MDIKKVNYRRILVIAVMSIAAVLLSTAPASANSYNYSTRKSAAKYVQACAVNVPAKISFYYTYPNDKQAETPGNQYDFLYEYIGGANGLTDTGYGKTYLGDYLYHEELLNLYAAKATKEKVRGRTYRITFYRKNNSSSRTTVANEIYVNRRIKSLARSLGLYSKRKTRKQKVRIIYRYITKNTKYAYNYNSRTNVAPAFTASVLKNHRGICNAYALTFYRLCREAGIPCRFITGYSNGSYHAWNIVKLGTRWYNCDSTWDTGVSRKNWSYFLRSNKAFKNHKREKQYRTSAFNHRFDRVRIMV